MNRKLIDILAFLTGAAIGSVVTWKLIEKKYKILAEEEIESVREYYSKKETPLTAEPKKVTSDNTQKQEYTKVLENLNYNHSNETQPVKVKTDVDPDIYIIPPESFGEYEDYKMATLTYYNADKTLTDEYDTVINDLEELIGEDPSIHFGEYEDDSVHVRNDKLRTDYEILLDLRSYDEAMSITSRPVDND